MEDSDRIPGALCCQSWLIAGAYNSFAAAEARKFQLDEEKARLDNIITTISELLNNTSANLSSQSPTDVLARALAMGISGDIYDAAVVSKRPVG